MKQIYMYFASLILAAGLAFAVQQTAQAQMVQEIITMWDFNDETLEPTIGEGTAINIGGTSFTWAAGVPGNPDKGWNTSSYPSQGEASGTAGVEFLVSTVGHTGIAVQLWQRSSGTGSRYTQVQYTLNGTEWIDFETYTNGPPHDTFYEHMIDFSGIGAASNNPDFGIRLVSIFSPEAFTDPQDPFTDWGANEAYRASRDDRNYGSSGTWRFDDVTFLGAPVGIEETRELSFAVNTTGNGISISNPENMQIEINLFDVLGNKLYVGATNNQHYDIPLAIRKQLVILSIKNRDGRTFTRKILVQ